MEHFRGRLEDSGKVLAEPIEGSFQVHGRPNGLKSWDGSFVLPSGQFVEPGGPYRLVLDDGRSADLLVTTGSYGSHQPSVVVFTGTGPAPR
jgi:hypothetical protein